MIRGRKKVNANRFCVLWALAAAIVLAITGCNDTEQSRRSVLAEGRCDAITGAMPGHLAYATRSSIDVITPNAPGKHSLRTIGEPNAFSIACDRDRVAYVATTEHGSGSELFVGSMSTGGSARLKIEEQLGPGAPATNCPPAWSPDDRWLATGWQLEGDNNRSQVLLISSASDEIVKLEDVLAEPRSTAGTSCPSWSLDGRLLALMLEEGTAASVWIVDLATGDTLSNISGARWPAWSPDGTMIAFSLAPGGIGPSGGLAVSDPNGKNRSVVSDSQAGARPVWSPVGSHIAFQSGLHLTDSYRIGAEITVSSLDGEVSRRLAGLGETSIDPTWSPDGQSIAWARAIDDAPLSVWQVELSGGTTPLPVTETYSRSPAWF